MIDKIIGQEISVNVSKNMKAQVIPQGNSYQATREGYNLFDYLNKVEDNGGLTYTIDKDTGYITANGTPTWDYATCVKSFNIDDLLEDGETYSVWQEVYSESSLKGLYAQITMNPKDGGTTQFINSSTVRINFKVNKSKYSYTLAIQCATKSIAGTFNNYKNRYMLYKNNVYKPYQLPGKSPSLDYPSEVEAVGDNINLISNLIEDWEQGTIKAEDGKLNNLTTRIRTKNYIEIENSSNITCQLLNTNYQFLNVHFYGQDFAYLGNCYSLYNYSNFNLKTMNLPDGTKYIKVVVRKTDNTEIKPTDISDCFIKVEESKVATSYSPYNQGSVEIVHNNKNFLNLPDLTYTQNGVTIEVTKGNHFKISGTANGSFTKTLYDKTVLEKLNIIAYNKYPVTLSRNTTDSFPFELDFMSATSGYYMQLILNKTQVTKNILSETFTGIKFYIGFSDGRKLDYEFDLQLEISNQATDIVQPKENTYTLPIQKPMLNGDYIDLENKKEVHIWKKYIKNNIADFTAEKVTGDGTFRFICNVENGNQSSSILCNMFKFWDKTYRNTGCFISYNSKFYALIKFGDFGFTEDLTIDQAKQKFGEIIAETNLVFYYTTTTPEELDLNEEQTQVLEQLSNLYLYEGINYLYSTDDLSPIFQFSYDKIVNDFKFYLSENGRLIFPNENISFLCSISESSIPSMPEALETSATIAGRDGDVPLNTTYGPLSFELILYTEDNLTPEEKLKQEIFLNRFCNSIKNNTETFALELAQKFYKIKYNGLLNKENYPKFLKFTLPFKSSKSFAYDVKKHIIYGNSTVESNTIEPTGFECVIKGPALKPIISLNDYSIEYDNTILEDESLVIDTNNSTAVLVSFDGTETNAMRYYNHQFPKILNGENELKILSGIDNPENVSISWYDLTL